MKSIVKVIAFAVVVAYAYGAMAADYVDWAVVVSVAPNMVPSPPNCTTEAVAAAPQPSPERSMLGMAAGAADWPAVNSAVAADRPRPRSAAQSPAR